MDTLIKWAIGGAIALAIGGALWGAWVGFKGWVSAPYVQEQIQADQKVVNAANRRADEAEAKTERAEGETRACLATSDRQSKAAEKSEKMAKAAQADADAVRAKSKREAMEAAPRIAELQAQAGAAPKLMACTDELGKAKLIMVNSLRAKRGLPPVTTIPANTPSLPALVK